MFDQNYEENYGAIVKKWAGFFYVFGIVFLCLSALTAIILVLVADYLWWVSLIVLGGGIALGLFAMFSGHITWGFAELVSNTQIIASKETEDQKEKLVNTLDQDLPEL